MTEEPSISTVWMKTLVMGNELGPQIRQTIEDGLEDGRTHLLMKAIAAAAFQAGRLHEAEVRADSLSG